jgi:hypothetical protein
MESVFVVLMLTFTDPFQDQTFLTNEKRRAVTKETNLYEILPDSINDSYEIYEVKK